MKIIQIILILIYLLFSTTLTIALNTCNTGFKINTSYKTINCHGVCKKVKSNSSINYFVPTKTSNEWSYFRNNIGNRATLINCNTCSSESITLTETNSNNCPSGENTISQINNISSYKKITAYGSIKSGWGEKDLHKFKVNRSGTIKMSLSASQGTLLKAGNSCGSQDYFRVANQTYINKEFYVTRRTTIHFDIYHDETYSGHDGNGYNYTLTIEYIPDGSSCP